MRPIRGAIAIPATLIMAVAAADSLPDPTRPTDAIGPSAISGVRYTGPVLQSTFVSPQKRSAVISGQRVKIGDTFEGAMVVGIAPYEVRLSRGGRETTLRLMPKLAKEKGKVE